MKISALFRTTSIFDCSYRRYVRKVSLVMYPWHLFIQLRSLLRFWFSPRTPKSGLLIFEVILLEETVIEGTSWRQTLWHLPSQFKCHLHVYNFWSRFYRFSNHETPTSISTVVDVCCYDSKVVATILCNWRCRPRRIPRRVVFSSLSTLISDFLENFMKYRVIFSNWNSR